MSTEVNCMNGGNSEIHHQQQQSRMDGMENNLVLTNTPAVVKPIVAEETDFFPEAIGANNLPSGPPCSGTGAGSGSRSQKSKKRQNQKTFSLMDIFDMHKGIGSWADAAADVQATSNSPSTLQESSEAKQVSNAMQQASPSQQGDWNQYPNVDGNIRPPSLGLDRATHSRNLDLANLPDRPPFDVKVANINYKSSDDDLFYFFGGEGNVVNIRSEGQTTRRGIAIISLSTQEALVNALKLNGMELQGRSLRISVRDQSRPLFGSSKIPLQDHQPRPPFGSGNVGPNNAYGHYRNNGSYHEGGYSTMPHPRRGPSSASHHAYNSDGRTNRIPLQHCSSYRGRDNRRYDCDSRLFRHSRPGNNQFPPRFTNRGSDSYGVSLRPSPLNENYFSHRGVEMEHDADRKNSGRIRTESVQSNTTDSTEKHERRKLQLQPRTKPLNNIGEDLPARPTSIFGLAKPVDTYKKEKQAEERLRLENESFRAAEQRSRKNSERAVSVPASPLFIHGHSSVISEKMLHDNRENCPPAVQKTIAGNGEKLGTTSVITELVTNEERAMEETETSSLLTTLTSVPQLPPPESSAPVAVRRQSFSNCPEISETRTTTALLRTRNSYNRTFTRSRDSVRTQFAPNKLHNIPVRRGKNGSRRGGSNNGNLGSDKREKVEGSGGSSGVVSVACNGPKQVENGPKSEQSASKEEKHEFVTTSTMMATIVKQPWQQHSDQQYSKREKKKQIAAVREMPKYIEPKPFTFSSENNVIRIVSVNLVAFLPVHCTRKIFEVIPRVILEYAEIQEIIHSKESHFSLSSNVLPTVSEVLS
ncbi:putative RNA-binding protein [Dirofilaria immitis]